MKVYTTEVTIDEYVAIKFVGIHEDKFMAYATLHINSLAVSEHYKVQLEDMHVSEEYRNQGYGKELVKKMLEVAKQHQFAYVTLHVNSNNLIAKSLYENMGFVSYVGQFEITDITTYYIELR